MDEQHRQVAVMIRPRRVMCLSRRRHAGPNQYTRNLAWPIATDRTTTMSRLLVCCRAILPIPSTLQLDRSQVVKLSRTTSGYFSNFLRAFACCIISTATRVTPGPVEAVQAHRRDQWFPTKATVNRRSRCGSTCTSPLGDCV